MVLIFGLLLRKNLIALMPKDDTLPDIPVRGHKASEASQTLSLKSGGGSKSKSESKNRSTMETTQPEYPAAISITLFH